MKSKSAASIQSDYNAKIAQQKTDTANQVTQTQTDYANNIANTTTDYNKQISDTNNWQTAFPADIKNENPSISSYSVTSKVPKVRHLDLKTRYKISEQRPRTVSISKCLQSATDPNQKQRWRIKLYQRRKHDHRLIKIKFLSYNQQISNDNSDIFRYQTAIAQYEKLTATYTAIRLKHQSMQRLSPAQEMLPILTQAAEPGSDSNHSRRRHDR